MKRSKHNLGCYRLLTGDMGQLLPVGLWEVLPGDTFQHNSAVMVRLSPMVAPVMHGMEVRIHHWFVPYRLLWEDFEKFITGGPDGMDASTPPQIVCTGNQPVLDHMGVPQNTGLSVSAAPVRAYNLIWNDFYRDQDLQAERGEDDATLAPICWEKDQYTTARPWPQKGPEVTIPLGEYAPIRGLGYETAGIPATVHDINTLQPLTATDFREAVVRIYENGQTIPGHDRVFADLSMAGSAPVDEVRRAFALQRFAEARARYGSRYVEYLRYLGVKSADGRGESAEYLGGGRARINISEVLQTAPETGLGGDADTEYGVGDLYGHGIAAMRSNRYRRFFDEHGWVLSLLSVRPKALYMDGVDKMWLRRDREDFFQKELQYIGQEPIKMEQIYTGDMSRFGETWGWQDRYRDYREASSRVSGEFRDVLDYWHLGRGFAGPPALNAAFVGCNPSKRIFQVQTHDVLWCMVQHHLVARRLVEKGSAAKII